MSSASNATPPILLAQHHITHLLPQNGAVFAASSVPSSASSSSSSPLVLPSASSSVAHGVVQPQLALSPSSSSGGGLLLSSPSGPPIQVPKRRVVDKSIRKSHVKPQLIQQCRTGYTRLISVAQFRDAYMELDKRLEMDKDVLDQLPPPDLSVEDVKVDSPFQAIEKAISAEVSRLSQMEDDKKLDMDGTSYTQPVPMPELKALNDPLIPLKKKRRKAMGKQIRKEMNCMTEKTFAAEVEERSKAGHHPMREHEVILKVAIFHPHNFQKMQDFLVLGSQPLSTLRDRISCTADEELDGPQTPSGFFFIEGKFYNDLRDRRALKYSDSIVNWVKQDERYTHPGLSHFETGVMHETLFEHLAIRLGSHYLYQHQGDCKHTIMFTDLRIAHSGDVQNALVYPLKVFQAKLRRKKCRVCDLFAAKMVTYGDRLAHENPFFWCESCYKLYHYNANGVILYSDFQVYPYS